MSIDDITESLLSKINRTEKNIVRKENAEIEMMGEINLGILTTLKNQIAKIEDRSVLQDKVKKLLLSRIDSNPDEFDLPTPYVIKLLSELMAADSRDTGNFMNLIKSENNNAPPLPDPNSNIGQIQQDSHASKEEIKNNKKFLEALDSIRATLDEIEKTENAD